MTNGNAIHDAETAPDVAKLMPWLVGEPDNQGEWAMHCPLHEDRNASASVNFEKSLWRCFAGCPDGEVGELIHRLHRMGMGVEGGGTTVTAKGDRGGFTADVGDLRSGKSRRPQKLPSGLRVDGWHNALLRNHERLTELYEKRGLTRELVELFKLGWDEDAEAYTIPFVEGRRIVNVKWYRIAPRGEQRKMWGVGGHNEARLYPGPPEGSAKDVMLCAGEMDTLLAIQHGYEAVTGSGGEGTWKSEWNPHFKDKRVSVVYDRDAAGDKGSRKVRRELGAVASEVREVTLPFEWTEENGKDLTDLWADDPEGFKETIDRVIAEAEEPDWDRPTQSLSLTDYGNAERLVEAYGDRLRYVPHWKRWLVWNGQRWRPDEDGEVERMAKRVIRDMTTEALAVLPEGYEQQKASDLDHDSRKALAVLKHAKHSEAEPRLRAMVRLAQSEPGIPVRPDELDADPWLINFQNGTVDLRTGTLHAPDPDNLMTKTVTVDYDPEAKCPRWDRFLKEVLPDPDVRAFMKRAFGYSLTGAIEEQGILVLWGSGRNGKSEMVKAVHHPLGDYGFAASNKLLLKQDTSSNAASPETARLPGKRMVTTAETDEGRYLSEATVKQFTGGDRILARANYGHPFEFYMTAKIFLMTNSKPLVNGQNPAIWERIFPVKFPSSFVGREEAGLSEVLAEEAEGIMRWAVEGCLEWQAEGLNPPLAVLAERENYRSEMDTLGMFLEDRCVTDPHAESPSMDLFNAWKEWAQESNVYAGTATAFVRKMLEREGFEKTGRKRFRSGENPKEGIRGVSLKEYEPMKRPGNSK